MKKPTCKNKNEIYCIINQTKLLPISPEAGKGLFYECPRCGWVLNGETGESKGPEVSARTPEDRQKIIERQFDSVGISSPVKLRFPPLDLHTGDSITFDALHGEFTVEYEVTQNFQKGGTSWKMIMIL